MKNQWLIYIVIVLIIGFFIFKNKAGSKDDIQLSENFKLSEFTRTSRPFPNIPSRKHVSNLKRLVDNILQPLRDYVKRPIIITSGYRSEAVNSSLQHSSKTSQHMEGNASDIHIPGMTNDEIVTAIKKLKLPYDQLIDEELYYDRGGKLVKASHIHISYDPSLNRRKAMYARNTPKNLKAYYSSMA